MRRGFTMIELLVVIAVIAILAGILFPVFGMAKAKAKQTKCLSNLKQIGTAITLYMEDSDDLFPTGIDASDKYVPSIWNAQPNWKATIPNLPLLASILQPYVQSVEIFHCPSDDGTNVLDNNYPQAFVTAPSLYAQYGSSYFLRTEVVFRSFSGTAFAQPANINLMMDGAGHWHGSARAIESGDDLGTFEALTSQYRYNVLFGDFHAKNVDKATMSDLWATPL